MLIYKQNSRFIFFAGLKSNITSIKSIDRTRDFTDEAENITQQSWDYLRPTPRYGHTRTYVVFNPRFETDPLGKSLLLELMKIH